MYYSQNNVSFFSHIGSSAQRLPNGNTLICSDTSGHFFEVTAEGKLVWEYINPVTKDGGLKVLPDSLPMTNSVFRAYRYTADHPGLKGHDLTPGDTITGDSGTSTSTPTPTATAYIEGLRDGVFKPTPARLDAMHSEAQHLQRLIEDLRTLSLADAGELAIQPVAVPPAALLERLAVAYAPQAQACDVTLQVSAEPDLPEILADPERMIQVLGNLAGNALRYTPSGGHIRLSARRKGVAVVLAVQDDGAGMSPDVLPHIFDRFYRGDPARSQEDSESGLGLAIAKSITEAHGGTIEVQSEPGRGTTFTVLVPAA
jgi:signal transduction histidine kinase